MVTRINHTIILDDPYDDPAGLDIPDRSPEPTSELLQVLYIPTYTSSLVYITLAIFL